MLTSGKRERDNHAENPLCLTSIEENPTAAQSKRRRRLLASEAIEDLVITGLLIFNKRSHLRREEWWQ